jgi:precorrin-2 dehydrogenase/sirohydrochlorin ferrochelatase
MPSAFHYPIALDLTGKTCVVVGAGPVGRRRAAALAAAGATVRVIALETTGAFHPDHLDGAFLAVAATDDPAVNGAVARAARAHGVLLGLAAPGDGDETGDFVPLSAVRRGDLLLGVTTGGAGPALARRLTQDLAERYPPAWEAYCAVLATLRQEAKRTLPDPDRRAAALRRLAENATVREKALHGDPDGALREGRSCLL